MAWLPAVIVATAGRGRRRGRRRPPGVARPRPVPRGDHARVRGDVLELAVPAVGLHRLASSATTTPRARSARDRDARLLEPPQHATTCASACLVVADDRRGAAAAHGCRPVDDRGARQRGDGGGVDGRRRAGSSSSSFALSGGIAAFAGLPVRHAARAGDTRPQAFTPEESLRRRRDRDHRRARLDRRTDRRRAVGARPAGAVRRHAAGPAVHEQHRAADPAHVLPGRPHADRVLAARRRPRRGPTGGSPTAATPNRCRRSRSAVPTRGARASPVAGGDARGWRCADVSVRFGGNHAVDDVSLEVHARRARRADRHQRRRQVDADERDRRLRAVDRERRGARPRRQRPAGVPPAPGRARPRASRPPGCSRSSRCARRSWSRSRRASGRGSCRR